MDCIAQYELNEQRSIVTLHGRKEDRLAYMLLRKTKVSCEVRDDLETDDELKLNLIQSPLLGGRTCHKMYLEVHFNEVAEMKINNILPVSS